MKKIKLLLAAMAAMVSLGASAQAWTASEVGAGNYVIYNVGSGQFLTAGNAWGTQASITTAGVSGATQVELIVNGDNYFIRTGVGNTNNGLENLADAGAVYMDQSRNKQSTWTFTQVSTDNGPVYNIISADNHGGGSGAYLTANEGNTVVSDNGTATSVYAQWKLLAEAKIPLVGAIEEYTTVRSTVLGFMNNTSAYTDETGSAATLQSAIDAQDEVVAAATTVDEINAAKAAVFAAGNTFLSSIIITSGFDITNAWITNPAPGISGNLTGWTNSGTPGVQSQLYEYWQVSAGTTKQTLKDLPKGAYKLTAIAYTRTGMVATLYAGENSTNIVTVDKGTVNDRAGGSTWIAAGNGMNDLNFTLDEATESLEIGLIADNTTGDHWMCWRSFSLTYYGDPINLAKADLANAVAAAEAYEGTVPTAVYATIAAAITANNKAYDTVDEYNAAVAAINAAVAENASAAIVASFARYQTVRTDALAIAAGTDVAAADEAANAATTSAAIEAAIATLRAAFMAELPNVTIEEGAYLDVTNVLVDNPSVRVNTDYWTAVENGSAKTSGSWAVVNYGETEFYDNNFKFYQTLALSKGTWEFGVTGFHRAGNHSTYFYAGEDKILIPGVESSVVNNMAQAQTYFNNGNGKVALKFGLEEAGDVEIGIDNQDTQTDKWTIFRDFTLKYYGAEVDYSEYVARVVATAEAGVAELEAIEGKIPEEIYSFASSIEAYTNAEDVAAEFSSKADFLEAIEVINSTVASAKTWVAPYAVYAPAFNGVEGLLAADYKELVDGAHATLEAALEANTFDVYADDQDALYTYAENLTAAAKTYVFNANPTGDAKFDLTFLLTNPDVSGFAAWTARADVPGWYSDMEDGNSQTMTNEAATSEDGTKTHFFEYWSKPAKANDAFALYQKVTLPAGTYDINCYAFAQDQYAGTNSVGVYFYANDVQGSAVTTARLTQAGISFVNDAEQEVKIGLKTIAGNSYNWMGIGYVELYKVAAKVVTIDENVDYVAESAAAKVELKRTIKAKTWNTIVLPFQLTAAELQAAFGDDVQIAEFSESSTDANAVEVAFNVMETPAIAPNKPVLLKTSTAGTEYTFEGRTIAAGDAKVAGANVDFVGTYAASTTVAEGNYFISGDKLYKSTGATTIKGTRAYIDAKNVSSVKLFIDGLETAISAINGDATENGAIFNLAGQRVSKAQKGIFIVGGKKVLVK